MENSAHAMLDHMLMPLKLTVIYFLENPEGLDGGDMLDVKIKRSEDYDLYAGPN